MNRRSLGVLIISLLVILSFLSLVSCKSSGGTSAQGDITIENIVTRVQDAVQELRSYEFDLELTGKIEGEVDGEAGKIAMLVKANGAMDLPGKKQASEMAMTVTGQGGDEKIDEAMKMATYVIGETMYIGTSDDAGKMRWQHQSAPSVVWNQQNQIGQQMNLLESSKIKYLKTEKVQGTQCYVVEIDPDLSILWADVMKQFGSMTPGPSTMPMSVLSNAMKKVTVKYWFTEDALYFRKIYIYIDMEIDAAQMGADKGQLKYIVEMTTDISKYNESVDIQLPADAG